MKQLFIIIIVLFTIVACNKSKEESNNISKVKAVKRIDKDSDFGFNFANFNVVQDTVNKGDTFGTILSRQNLGNSRVYDVVEKVKDTFNVRSIRPNKAYTILRSKDKQNKIQAFIYQPNSLSYYVIDFRDSIVSAYKKVRPVTIRRRMIGGVLKGSLSETLVNAGVQAALASKMTKVYSWSIDFFKLKKGDRFGLVFTERYINDSIYDGVEDLEASFFEYKGKIIYAFSF